MGHAFLCSDAPEVFMSRVIVSKNDVRLAPPISGSEDSVHNSDLSGSRELLEHDGNRQKQFEQLLRAGERKSDDYSSRLVKYIPSEVIALYVTLGTIIDSAKSESKIALSAFVLILGLLATPLYLWRILKVNKVRQLAISTGAYVVWVIAIKTPPFLANAGWYEPQYAALLLPVYTFAAALIEA
jgi:hypothetical protein